MYSRKRSMIAILFATMVATAVFLSLISSSTQTDPPDVYVQPEVIVMQDWPEVRLDATKRAYIVHRYPRDGDLSILESMCYDPLLGPSAIIHTSLCDEQVSVTSRNKERPVVVLTGTPNTPEPTYTPIVSITGTPNTPTVPPPTITDTPIPTSTPIPTNTPTPEPTKTKKPKCNKGDGNGGEGCDPGNHPEKGNDDED